MTADFVNSGAISNSKYCSGCGQTIHQSALACPKCGAPQAGVVDRKSRIAAALLALFLGGIGVHKFYLGRAGQGILYLIFCWTLVPALIAFVEFIVYLCMTDEVFATKYG